MTEYKTFLKDFVREDSDQFTLIRATEIFAATNQAFNNSFHIIVQVLYTLKVLTGKTIQQWRSNAVDSLKN